MYGQLRERELRTVAPGRFYSEITAPSSGIIGRLQRRNSALEGHHGCVNTVSFTNDGERLISGSDDRHIIIWDWNSNNKGQQVMRWETGHISNIFQAKTIGYGNNNIVSCAHDGQVRMHMLSSSGYVKGKLIGRHSASAHKLAVHPEQVHVFYSSGEDGAVRRYDIRKKGAGSEALLSVLSSVPARRNRGPVDLNTVHCNPMRPEQFAVGGDEEYAYVYDVRKLAASQATSSTAAQPYIEPLDTFCPTHLHSGKRFSDAHITAAVYSQTGELLVTYHDERIYLFHPWHRGRSSAQVASASAFADKAVKGEKRRRSSSNVAESPPTRSPRKDTNGIAKENTCATGSDSKCQQLHGIEADDDGHMHVDGKAGVPEAGANAGASAQSLPPWPAGASHAQRDASVPPAAQEAMPAQHVSSSDAVQARQAEPAATPSVPATDADVDVKAAHALVSHMLGESAHVPSLQAGASAPASAPASDSASDSGEGGSASTQGANSQSESEGASVSESGESGDEVERMWMIRELARRRRARMLARQMAQAEQEAEAETAEQAHAAAADNSDSDDGDAAAMRGPFRFAKPEPQRPRDKLRHCLWSHCEEEVPVGWAEPGEDCVVQSYCGHCNERTVKGVNFLGRNDEYVVSGSDCGHLFVWSKRDGCLRRMAHGDSQVLNCLEPHPQRPLTLATSGIDSDIKIWEPRWFDEELGPAERSKRIAKQLAVCTSHVSRRSNSMFLSSLLPFLTRMRRDERTSELAEVPEMQLAPGRNSDDAVEQ